MPSAALAQAPVEVTLAATDHNGYNISCFGAQDGAINATVSGGTPPYSYKWTNGAETEDIADLPAGYYRIEVTDANGVEDKTDITLTEPLALAVQASPSVYPNGMNLSCYECYNGSIDVGVQDGVPPYSYAWADGPTTEDRAGLGALKYTVEVTDANGCTVAVTTGLQQPERDDWSKSGSAGTNPATQFLGTTDAKDLVLKSNGTEVIRLKSNGDIRLLGSLTNTGVVYRLGDGTLRAGLFQAPLDPPPLCMHMDAYPPFWQTLGNNFEYLCPEDLPLLGTLSEHPVRVVTNGEERIFISATGKVGIGTTPVGPIVGYRLYVEDGIATRDVLVKLGAWPDYVFEENYRLMPIAELREFVKRNSHLPGIPSAAELEAKGGLVLGDIARDLTRTVEEQTLYILQLEERTRMQEERLNAMEQRITHLETSK